MANESGLWDHVTCFACKFEGACVPHKATGLMHAAGLLPPTSRWPGAARIHEPELTLLRLAAAWMRLVELDQAYDLANAKRLVAESIALFRAASETPVPRDLAPQRQMVLARWSNAAARISYRLRDYPRARSLFRGAIGLAWNQGNPLACWADLASDWVRNERELRNAGFSAAAGEIASGFPAEVANAIEASTQGDGPWPVLLSSALGAALGAGQGFDAQAKDAGASGARALLAALTREGLTERTAGCFNILHNWQLVGKANIPDELLMEVVKLFEERGEVYRSVQIRCSLASPLAKLGKVDDVREILDPVMRSPMVRQHYIARQRLADALWNSNQREASLTTLAGLLMELGEARRSLATDYFHHEVHNYALGNFETKLKAWQASAAATGSGALWPDVIDESRQLVESLRSLVSLTQYKHDFTNHALLRVHACIESLVKSPGATGSTDASRKLTGDDPMERLVDFAEMVSCRALLDVLGEAIPPVAGTLPAPRLREEFLKDAAQNGGSFLRRLRGADPLALEVQQDAYSLRLADYERRTESVEVPSSAHDRDALYHAFRFAQANEGTAFIRYIKATSKQDAWAVVVTAKGLWIKKLNLPENPETKQSLTDIAWDLAAGWPEPCDCRKLYEQLIQPLEEHLGNIDRLVIVPMGPLWKLPFHAALSGEGKDVMTLGQQFELIVTPSLTAYVSKGRWQNDIVRKEESDDLFLISALEEASAPRALVENLNWTPSHLHLWGAVPDPKLGAGIQGAVVIERESLLQSMAAHRPEFVVWAGHGLYDGQRSMLAAPDGTPLLYPLDLLYSKCLPRNKLCVLGACVSASADTGEGGEIAGFIRAFLGTGAGMLLATRWQVLGGVVDGACQYILSHMVEGESKSIAKLLRDWSLEATPSMLEMLRDSSADWDDPELQDRLDRFGQMSKAQQQEVAALVATPFCQYI